MIDRDREGRLTIDGKTSLLIAGMPPGELTEKMHAFEKLYQKWLGVQVDEETGHVLRSRWYTPIRRFVARVCSPVQIFRSEIYELTLASVSLSQAEKARTMREDYYAEYLKLIERERDLRKFLFEHYPEDLSRAEHQNLALVDLAKGIMLRQLKAG